MESLCRFAAKRDGGWWTDLCVLALAFGFSFTVFLGTFPLMDPDEGRYAEIPREMLEGRDFITPRLCGAKFLYKPPLIYWMNAASMALLGEGEFAARLPSALCGLLTLLLVYWTGRRLFGRRVGVLSAFVLGTSAGFFICTRLCIVDMPLALFMTAALSCRIVAYVSGDSPGALPYLSWASLAFAALAKGPVGVLLPVAAVSAHALIARRPRLLSGMHWGTGLPLFILIAAPWFVLVSIRNPEFAHFFFIREHIGRFFTPLHHREEPFGFFFPIALLMLFPWSLFLPAAARQIWRERGGRGERIHLFLCIWAAVIFVFFSLSKSALVTYIIPLLPPVSILMGAAFSRLFDGVSRSWMWQAHAAAAILCLAGIFGCFYPSIYPIRGLSHPGFIAMGALVFAGGILSWMRIRRGNAAGFFCALLLTVYCTDIIGSRLIPRVFMGSRSCRRLALIARGHLGPDTLLASYLYTPSLAFYTRRPFVMVDAPQTLDFFFGVGGPGEPDLFMDFDRFLVAWNSDRHVLALMNRRDARYLAESARTPVAIIGRMGGRVLASNRGAPVARPAGTEGTAAAPGLRPGRTPTPIPRGPDRS